MARWHYSDRAEICIIKNEMFIFRKNTPRKLTPHYFERSLRFPVAFIYLLIFMGVLAEKIYTNYGFSTLSPTQGILIGCGFAVFLLIEGIEGLAYPKTPYFFLGVLLTGLRIIALYAIAISDPTGISSTMVGFILFTMCFYFTPLPVLPLLLIYLFVFYLDLGAVFLTGQFDIGSLYEMGSFVVLYLLAVVIKWDDHVRRRNQILVGQLESYATNSISLGKQEERNRISRDLHDSLGHHLVAINIQLQKAVAYREIDAAESQSAVEKAQQATNDSIQELRQTIKDLREFEEETSLDTELEDIVAKVRENGLSLDYTHNGSYVGFPELTLLTLKQVVQEGLTNIQKHAQAQNAKLQIDFQRKHIQIRIEDDGMGFNPKKVNKDNHFGLQGMQERVQIVGGKIKVTSQPGMGTKLFIRLPKDIYG